MKHSVRKHKPKEVWFYLLLKFTNFSFKLSFCLQNENSHSLQATNYNDAMACNACNKYNTLNSLLKIKYKWQNAWKITSRKITRIIKKLSLAIKCKWVHFSAYSFWDWTFLWLFTEWVMPTKENSNISFNSNKLQSNSILLFKGLRKILLFECTRNHPNQIIISSSDYLFEVGKSNHLSLSDSSEEVIYK